ncbi:hypothetical protein OIU84_027773 [Salix udensis]|uniref:Uncharacterized protein n=1 Tax=Salix udensis TaxID=889485 RepID=A0AAD6PB05_9ROSI|nr:hypothetical protein OIU84_027773 [Salix udensis]
MKLKQSSSNRVRIIVKKQRSMPLSPGTTTADVISTESHLRQSRLILEYQELCDHYNAAVMQNQTRTFGINRDVAIEIRNNVHNVERERVTLPKSISVRSSGYVKKLT